MAKSRKLDRYKVPNVIGIQNSSSITIKPGDMFLYEKDGVKGVTMVLRAFEATVGTLDVSINASYITKEWMIIDIEGRVFNLNDFPNIKFVNNYRRLDEDGEGREIVRRVKTGQKLINRMKRKKKKK